jgi:tetratricopeptide (TPR) repeat protein
VCLLLGACAPLRTASIEALIAQAQTHAEAGDFASAFAALDAAHRLAPQRADVYRLCGALHLRIYEWDRALAAYDRALVLDPGDPEAYYGRGLVYASAPDGSPQTRARAAADFRRYLALAPQGARADAAARYLTQLEAAAGQ